MMSVSFCNLTLLAAALFTICIISPVSFAQSEGLLMEFKFGSLKPAFSANGSFYGMPVQFFQEDQLERGTFLFDHNGSAIMRFSPTSGNISVVCGSQTETAVNTSGEGPALGPRFTNIAGITQPSSKVIYIIDDGSSCIKKFDREAMSVKPFVGKCDRFINDVPDHLPDNLPNGTVTADSKYLVGISSFQPIKDGEYFVLAFYSSKKLYRYNPKNNTLEHLLPEDNLFTLSDDYTGFLLNKNGTGFYTFRSYGLSFYDLNSRTATNLTGVGYSSQDYPAKMLSGSYTSGVLQRLMNLHWLIPDRFFIAETDEIDDGLVIVDVVKQTFLYVCIGIYDYTIPGPIRSCQVNSISSLDFVNGTLFINSLTQGNFENETVLPSDKTSIFKMNISARDCDLKGQPLSLIVNPARKTYEYNSTIQLSCPAGQGLDAPYNTLICNTTSTSENGLSWNKPFPKCSNDLKVVSISPSSGLELGGNPIVAHGVIPRDGVSVELVSGKIAKPVDFDRSMGELLFRMPPMNKAPIVKLRFTLTNKNFTFTYIYLPDPVVTTKSVTTIPSGGVIGRFAMKNIDSAQNYRLTHLDVPWKDVDCRKKNRTSEVWCQLPGLPPSPYDQRFPGTQNFRIYLYADDVRLHKYELNMHMKASDPTIKPQNESHLMHNGASFTLQITGSNLDLHNTNIEYVVSLASNCMTSRSNRIPCDVMVENITDKSILCQVETELVAEGTTYQIEVSIGNLKLDAGFALVPAGSHPATKSKTTTIIAVTVSVAVAVVLIVIAVLLYRKFRGSNSYFRMRFREFPTDDDILNPNLD